ncbi:MAG: DUF4330 family protein [Clostridia bacterium]|nr:DUF4330 family protein [Clostridia bacterium]
MKKQRNYHLNWFDFLAFFLIVLVISAAVFAVLWTQNKKEQGTPGEKVSLRYVVEIKDIREEIADRVTKGDPVYLRDASGMVYAFGTVSGVQIETCYYTSPTVMEQVTSESGDYSLPVRSEKVGRVNVLISVECEALLGSDARYTIGGRLIVAGQEMELLSEHFTGKGYIISLDEKV